MILMFILFFIGIGLCFLVFFLFYRMKRGIINKDKHIQERTKDYVEDGSWDVVPTIFVSYSRKDLKNVETLVYEIEKRTGEKCWVDWNGVESGDQFTDVIVNAIDQAKIVLFILSDHSISSNFSKMEITYAKNTKKRIIPVVFDGGKLRGWFLFMLGNIDYIDIKDKLQKEKLFRNLYFWAHDKVNNETCTLDDNYLDSNNHSGNYPLWKEIEWRGFSLARVNGWCLILCFCFWWIGLIIALIVWRKNPEIAEKYIVGSVLGLVISLLFYVL